MQKVTCLSGYDQGKPRKEVRIGFQQSFWGLLNKAARNRLVEFLQQAGDVLRPRLS